METSVREEKQYLKQNVAVMNNGNVQVQCLETNYVPEDVRKYCTCDVWNIEMLDTRIIAISTINISLLYRLMCNPFQQLRSRA